MKTNTAIAIVVTIHVITLAAVILWTAKIIPDMAAFVAIISTGTLIIEYLIFKWHWYDKHADGVNLEPPDIQPEIHVDLLELRRKIFASITEKDIRGVISVVGKDLKEKDNMSL